MYKADTNTQERIESNTSVVEDYNILLFYNR
jgi:hypothetical protein